MIPNGALQRLQSVSWGEPACVQPVLPHIDVKRFFHGETKAGAMMFENGYVQQKIRPAYNRARIECRGRKPFINDRARKSVVQGQSVSVRGDLGGRRIITKNKRNRKCKLTKA